MLENQIEPVAEIKTKEESAKIEALHGSQPPQITLIPDVTKDYLKEEQKQRRQEIDHLMAKIEDDQRYGLIITGAVWSWLATNRDKLQSPFDIVAVFVPVVIMLFFAWRRKVLVFSIQKNAEYLKQLEGLFGVPEGFGWERWLEGYSKTSKRKLTLGRASKAFWYWLIMANLILAGLFIWVIRK
jgi:hypothetical protein